MMNTTMTKAFNNEPTIPCPRCRGTKQVYDTVQWSDGLGGIMADCRHCEDGQVFANANMETMRLKLQQAQVELVRERDEMTEIKKNVMRLMDSYAKRPFVRGLPGSCPHAWVWEKRLEEAVRPLRTELEAALTESETREHDRFHQDSVPSDSPAGFSRSYCKHCNPKLSSKKNSK
jgi:hypothetical protein